MTRFESSDEQRLHELLDQTMSTVEPDDRLDQIFARTKVTSMSARRPWLWGAGGAALATAAVITAVALVGNPLQKADELPPGGSNSPNPTQVTEPTQNTSAPTSSGSALPVYFVGVTPQGQRLYREFQVPTEGGDPATQAANLAVHGPALDPDYRTLWPAGTQVATATYNGDVLTVDLQNADGAATSIHDLQPGMTAAQADLAIQQVIYSAQAGLGKGRVPVQLLIDGSHTDKVLGQPASEPLAEGTWYDTLALVNITDPSEGTHVSGTLHVTGLASSNEATVPWQLLQGSQVVDQKFFMAEQGGDLVKLYLFAGDIDLTGLAPGTYTLRVQTDDPSGGEGPGPTEDTRTIVVE